MIEIEKPGDGERERCGRLADVGGEEGEVAVTGGDTGVGVGVGKRERTLYSRSLSKWNFH